MVGVITTSRKGSLLVVTCKTDANNFSIYRPLVVMSDLSIQFWLPGQLYTDIVDMHALCVYQDHWGLCEHISS